MRSLALQLFLIASQTTMRLLLNVLLWVLIVKADYIVDNSNTQEITYINGSSGHWIQEGQMFVVTLNSLLLRCKIAIC